MNAFLNVWTITQILFMQLLFVSTVKDGITFRWPTSLVSNSYGSVSYQEMVNQPTGFWLNFPEEFEKMKKEGKLLSTYYTFTLTAKVCSGMMSLCDYYLIWSLVDVPVAVLDNLLPEDRQYQEQRHRPVTEFFGYKMLDINEAFKKHDEIVIKASFYRQKYEIFPEQEDARQFIRNNSEHSRKFKSENTVTSEDPLKNKIAKLDFSQEFNCKKEHTTHGNVNIESLSWKEKAAQDASFRISYFSG